MEDLEFAEVFCQEATELLEELESALLALEKAPEDRDLVSRVFRAMHTIKGSGAMFGFDAIADFTHHVETVMDRVRNGSVAVTRELISQILSSRDHIQQLLDAAMAGETPDVEAGEVILRRLQQLQDGAADGPEEGVVEEAVPASLREGTSAADVPPAATAAGSGTAEETMHYCIHFRPMVEFFSEYGSVDQLLAELGQLGELTVFGKQEVEPEQDAFPDGKEPFWDILLTTARGEDAIRDIFIFVEHCSTIQIKPLVFDAEGELPGHNRLGEILLERGDISKEQLYDLLDQQKSLGEIMIETKVVSEEKVQSALAQQQIIEEKRSEVKAVPRPETVKVPAEKLDVLIDLVGELVVTQARLSQVTGHSVGDEVRESVGEIERLTTELRDCVLNIRMMPIGSSFVRYQRLVRDLARELGKEIQLVTSGEETELDKCVIDQLGDPLVHLIRNSIDHGIESPEERLAAGKPAQGLIRLEARHAGANVIIAVADDGRGLDVESIRQKAVERGLLSPDASPSDEELYRFVFGAGFSTSRRISSVSGRGVGMDVVKNTIENKLKGSVAVSSEVGGGTTVTITLPLTLAIIDGLLIAVGDTHFVLPLSMVEECVELTRQDIDSFHGRKLYPLRDQLIPYISMREFFRLPGEPPVIQQMVIVHCNEERLGLVLDQVVGGYQTVIKSLGWVYRNAQGVSGATVLGNGEVALIVDIPAVLRYARAEERVGKADDRLG